MGIVPHTGGSVIMGHELGYGFWPIIALGAVSSCATPSAKQPAESHASAPESGAVSQPSGMSKEERSLTAMHKGCVDSCVEAQGSEAPCGQLCTCIIGEVRKSPAAVRELAAPRSTESLVGPELQKTMVDATSSCSASMASMPKREYDPRALRALLGTSVNVATDHTPAPTPPAKLFDKVTYAAPLGDNVAYVSPVKKGEQRPAILWLAGGFDTAIGDTFWQPAPRSNDQSARAFRDAGIVLMLPALRGSNENPGHNECFFGEVEDVLAAAEFLAKRADVDPKRIYLGGHSTGGTLALLAAQSTKRFRAVFAFGPAADPRLYGDNGCIPAGLSALELGVRAPLTGMALLTTPTFVLEGLKEGNATSFAALRKDAPATVRFIGVPGGTHFSILSPGSEVIARAILKDTGQDPHLTISEQDVAAALTRH
jgi:acetyl esterase/lipase